MTGPAPLLRVRGLTRGYGQDVGCLEVDFDLYPGERRVQLKRLPRDRVGTAEVERMQRVALDGQVCCRTIGLGSSIPSIEVVGQDWRAGG